MAITEYSRLGSDTLPALGRETPAIRKSRQASEDTHLDAEQIET